MRRASSLVAALFAAGPALASDPTRTDEEAAQVAAVVAPTGNFDVAEIYEARPGGAQTGFAAAPRQALLHPFPGLSAEAERNFIAGQALFEKIWVAAPTATQASDGLGPLYNARACSACHVQGGRGSAPAGDGRLPRGLVLHVARPGGPTSEIEGWITTQGDPVYGEQIQDFGTVGQQAEARPVVSYTEIPVALAGGEIVHLRAPLYGLEAMAFGPLAKDTMLSPRMAPPMSGLGLIEAIPAEDILALADEDDADGDGISGRPNWLPGADGPLFGRFGLKAGHASVTDQSATAFANDIGISTPLHPAGWGDCTEAQSACRAGPHGDGDARVFEVDAAALDLVSLYAESLAPPARRDLDDPEVLRGKEVFYSAGCISCHRPKFVTARAEGDPTSFQLIWPYSDFLLHDMGEGLADGFAEGRATGREWRTAPLWGIGLASAANPAAGYLHDGRARSLLEAVLWHGGEALAARDHVASLPPADRDALIRFLESL